MEVIGEGLKAIGNAISSWAWAWAWIYIVGIGTKTFLIYTNKAKIEEFKNWFDIWKKKGF